MTKAILAMMTLVAFAASATAATTISTSKSNTSQFKSCVDGGGKVTNGAKGEQFCAPKKK